MNVYFSILLLYATVCLSILSASDNKVCSDDDEVVTKSRHDQLLVNVRNSKDPCQAARNALKKKLPTYYHGGRKIYAPLAIINKHAELIFHAQLSSYATDPELPLPLYDDSSPNGLESARCVESAE